MRDSNEVHTVHGVSVSNDLRRVVKDSEVRFPRSAKSYYIVSIVIGQIKIDGQQIDVDDIAHDVHSGPISQSHIVGHPDAEY